MPTQAISSYGIQLRLSDGVPLSALTINAATNATPIVVTTTAPHGIVDVGHVTISGVLGNTAANGTWVVSQVSTTQLRLRGSVGSGAYTSGGSLIRTGTFTNVAEITDLQDAGASSTLIDVSAHDGADWVSRIPTILTANAIRLNLNLVPGDPTHDGTTGFAALLLSKARRWWLVIFPDAAKTTWAVFGNVVTHRVNAPVNQALTAQTVIEIDGEPILAQAA